jgi:hypothetical protein
MARFDRRGIEDHIEVGQKAGSRDSLNETKPV